MKTFQDGEEVQRGAVGVILREHEGDDDELSTLIGMFEFCKSAPISSDNIAPLSLGANNSKHDLVRDVMLIIVSR